MSGKVLRGRNGGKNTSKDPAKENGTHFIVSLGEPQGVRPRLCARAARAAGRATVYLFQSVQWRKAREEAAVNGF